MPSNYLVHELIFTADQVGRHERDKISSHFRGQASNNTHMLNCILSICLPAARENRICPMKDATKNSSQPAGHHSSNNIMLKILTCSSDSKLRLVLMCASLMPSCVAVWALLTMDWTWLTMCGGSALGGGGDDVELRPSVDVEKVR